MLRNNCEMKAGVDGKYPSTPARTQEQVQRNKCEVQAGVDERFPSTPLALRNKCEAQVGVDARKFPSTPARTPHLSLSIPGSVFPYALAHLDN